MLLEFLIRHGLKAQEVRDRVLQTGSIRDVAGIPEELKQPFVTALEIGAEQHLRIQSAFQPHVDNSVSKTVNLPHEATIEDVADTYRLAWELGLKGITVC